MKKSIGTLAIAALIFATACSGVNQSNEKVRKLEVTEAEVDYELGKIPEEYKMYYPEEELRTEIKSSLIEQKVLRAEAESLGLDKEENYIREIENTKNNLLISALIEKKIMEGVTLEDGEVRAFYEENIEEFKEGEKVKARHILIDTRDADEGSKVEARLRAEKVLERALSGEDFSILAKETSEGPTGPRGGDLGWFERGQMVQSFEDAAFAGKKGEVYPQLVESQFGYHIIFVEDRSEGSYVDFDSIKDMLEEELLNMKRYETYLEYIEELKEKYGLLDK